MLNLVQLQERLKDVPMQALMGYANGMNPQVPPFLALGELNRRKKMQEGAAAQQAQEMEGAPTIKEQIEQSAGLLALQGSRQRQASQQQAGIQANMPMAAPNTTTSEPAQLAGGGFIDDIVVPRDYQAGGAIDVDALKRTMYRDAMQNDTANIPKELMDAVRRQALRNAPGLPSIPMSRGVLSRAGFAGGGIVAFESGGEVKRVSGKTLSEYLASVSDALKANTQMTEQEKIDAINRARVQFMNSPSDTGATSQSDEGRTASGLPREARGFMPTEQTGIGAGVDIDQILGTRTTGAPARGLGALSQFLKLKGENVYPTRTPKSFEEMMEQQKKREGLLGVSEEFLNERERRLGEIQARREKERAEQPMERLMEMLSGIAEARGGTFGTQGAAGAKRAIALEAQQRALRDKQDMDMEDLKFASATKRDAIRRGNLKDIEKATQAEEEAARKVMEDRANLLKSQATAETQGVQAESYARQVGKPTSDEQIQMMYRNYVQQKGLTPSVEGFLQFRANYLLGGKPSTTMTPKDAIRIATQQLKNEGKDATKEEVDARARELLDISKSLGDGGSSRPTPSVSTQGWGELRVK